MLSPKRKREFENGSAGKRDSKNDGFVVEGLCLTLCLGEFSSEGMRDTEAGLSIVIPAVAYKAIDEIMHFALENEMDIHRMYRLIAAVLKEHSINS